jgi:branched-subunit amino acid aminotransferase/4-amino-4-deoxychorismate lyase
MKAVNIDQWLNSIRKIGATKKYKAMYSTLWDGIVTDPAMMLIPIDDHMVHRGDGVFEALRFNTKKIYLLEPHLDRLFLSSDRIGLKINIAKNKVAELCESVRQASGLEEGILRVFVGRGGGDFSPNPYTTTGTEVHIVATDFLKIPDDKYKNGVSLMFSKIPVKQSPYPQIKSLNYLPNVLMKKESVDHGVDFSIGLTPEGYIAEGPTENILILKENGELTMPNLDYILKGTTLMRLLDLVKVELKINSILQAAIKSIKMAHIHKDEIFKAQDVMMIGTTIGVLPVSKVENKIVGSYRSPKSDENLLSVLSDLLQTDLIS